MKFPPSLTFAPALAPALALLLYACSSGNVVPEGTGLCAELACDPYRDTRPIAVGEHPDVLYATDRRPADPLEAETGFYLNRRGGALRLGVATLRLARPDTSPTWADAQRVPLLRDRSEDYPLQIAAVREFGIEPGSVSPLAPRELHERADGRAIEAFAEAIDARMTASGRRDVTVFVHGYKISFDTPLLAAAELSHYLGHRGVVIAYAWPSQETVWGYASDIESAVNSARNLRLLLQSIARQTGVERLNIVAHSAGSRLVTRALADIALADGSGSDGVATRIHNVILAGSDLDRDILAGYFLDGLLQVADSLTIYASRDDGALEASETVFQRRRVGQTIGEEAIDERNAAWLLEQSALHIIDVSDTPGWDAGRGHRYLRTAPWVRADILTTLLQDLSPAERGLERSAAYPLWRFPPDYPKRLEPLVEADQGREGAHP